MNALPNARLTHVGLFVRDLRKMSDYYCRMLGMVVTDTGTFGGRELAFLSRNPDEHHQVVMIHDPAREEHGSALNQISFRLDDLESVRRFHAYLAGEGATGLEGRNHGNSWSLYFFDPEGNKIELYCPTPWQLAQPWRAPLDLAQPAEAIWAETEQLVRVNPTMRPQSEWRLEMAQRLGLAPADAPLSAKEAA